MTAVARAEEPRQAPQPHDATSLSAADDRIRQSDWLPPQEGVVPRIRLGSRWINVLWAIPLIVVLLILGIAVGPAVAHDARRAGIHRALPRRHPVLGGGVFGFPLVAAACCISSISS